MFKPIVRHATRSSAKAAGASGIARRYASKQAGTHATREVAPNIAPGAAVKGKAVRKEVGDTRPLLRFTPLPSHEEWPPSASFASYKISVPPTPAQLRYADHYFLAGKPMFLSGAEKFRTLPMSSVPEVVFIGRSNVGKSSILNALLYRTGMQIARVSSRPGHTKEMNAFGIGGARLVGGRMREDGSKEPDRWEGRHGLVILDMPGYGHASRREWGTEIIKYLSGRQSLRRTFLLVDIEHSLKTTDMELLHLLQKSGIPYQIVLTKADKLLDPKGPRMSLSAVKRNLTTKYKRAVRETHRRIDPNPKKGAITPVHDILTCSAERDIPPGSGNKVGIDNLRWSILSASNLDCGPDGAPKKMHFDLQEEPEVVESMGSDERTSP